MTIEVNKIYKGDCLELMKEIPDNSIDLVVTSPPYAQQRKDTYGGIDEQHYPDWFVKIGIEIKRILKPQGSFILNIKEHTKDGSRSLYVYKTIIKLVEECGFYWIDTFAWTKNSFPGRIKNKFKNAWEPCYHFAKSLDISIYPDAVSSEIKPESTARAHRAFTGKTKNGSGFLCTASDTMKNLKKAYPSNHLAINNILNQFSDNNWHPAVYPISLCDFFIKAYTTENDLVLDPFGGSGTTALSAIELNRNYILFEMNDSYFQQTKERIDKVKIQTKLL